MDAAPCTATSHHAASSTMSKSPSRCGRVRRIVHPLTEELSLTLGASLTCSSSSEWNSLKREDLAGLRALLLIRPDAGAPIPKSRGLRKVRVPAKGKGKRGGARVVYYWHAGDGQIFLLIAYAKNTKDDLIAAQMNALSAAVEG